MQRLATVGATTAAAFAPDTTEVVYPVVASSGTPNRGVTNKIAALVQVGDGPRLAEAMSNAIAAEWHRLVRECFGTNDVLATPGMPDLWWVCVSGGREDYRTLWRRGAELAVARRRSRVFTPLGELAGGWLCSQSPRLLSVRRPRNNVRGHERGERLSAAGWVKRTYRRGQDMSATPSTLSVASTTLRVRLLRESPQGLTDQVSVLREAASKVAGRLVAEQSVVTGVPIALSPLATELGAWVDPARWDTVGLGREFGTAPPTDVVASGRRAAIELVRLATAAGIAPLTPYYAVVVQDLDHLGRAMAELELADQRVASEQLVALGQAQRDAAGGAELPGVPIYTGGDDFLTFCPAAGALTLAARVRRLVDEHLGDGPLRSVDGRPITASTAVVFAHAQTPLRTVMEAAGQTLTAAKQTRSRDGRDRDAIGVLVLRRHGERTRSIQPWAHDPVARWEALRPEHGGLSGGLASQLEQDAAHVSQLAADPRRSPTLEAELTRLVLRHSGGLDEQEALRAAVALHELAWAERDRTGRGISDGPDGGETAVRYSRWPSSGNYRPVSSLLVARFMSQECR
ncbi:MAG TPA: hypothetical protein VFW65_07840 [Pseudonocardiaceae bacterium]|nr:hypothetical protein [Pseudonocardiaceae bacterium]